VHELSVHPRHERVPRQGQAAVLTAADGQRLDVSPKANDLLGARLIPEHEEREALPFGFHARLQL